MFPSAVRQGGKGTGYLATRGFFGDVFGGIGEAIGAVTNPIFQGVGSVVGSVQPGALAGVLGGSANIVPAAPPTPAGDGTWDKVVAWVKANWWVPVVVIVALPLLFWGLPKLMKRRVIYRRKRGS